MRRIAIGSLSLGLFALVLTGCQCTQNDPCYSSGSVGPSRGELVAIGVGIVAAVGVGTGVIIEVEHSHHNIKGCTFNGPDGLGIEDAGTHKRFILSGTTANLKEGMLVRVHGSRAKRQKGSKTDQTFVVESVKKNYGACTVESPGAKAGAKSGVGS